MNRPRTCGECPFNKLCSKPEGPGLPPGGSDACRSAWQAVYEWVSEELLDGLERENLKEESPFSDPLDDPNYGRN